MSALALGPLGVRIRQSLPLLPVGARVAVLGDSITQFNNSDNTTGTGPLSSQSQGELVSAQMLDPRFRCDVWLSTSDTRANRYFSGANQGVTGDTISSPGPAASTTGMLGRLATDILPLKPDVCIVAGGTNNVTATNNLSGLQAICSTLASNGIKPVVCTVRPWTAARSGDSAALQQAALTLNANIRAFAAATPSITLCDLAAAYGCPGPTWAYAPTSYIGSDGLHPAAQGGYVGGKALVSSLASAIQSGNWPLNAFWNIGTNLVPSSVAILNGGTAGSKGTVVTGSVATGVAAYASTNSTMVASLIANATTGGMSQQFVVTPAGTATSESIPLSVKATLTGTTTNTYYIAFAEVEFDAWPAWAGSAIKLGEVPASSSLVAYGMQPADVTKTAFPEAARRWVVIPPYKTTASATGLQLSLNIFFVPNGASGTGTFKLHRWGVFTMPDPHTVWNS